MIWSDPDSIGWTPKSQRARLDQINALLSTRPDSLSPEDLATVSIMGLKSSILLDDFQLGLQYGEWGISLAPYMNAIQRCEFFGDLAFCYFKLSHQKSTTVLSSGNISGGDSRVMVDCLQMAEKYAAESIELAPQARILSRQLIQQARTSGYALPDNLDPDSPGQTAMDLLALIQKVRQRSNMATPGCSSLLVAAWLAFQWAILKEFLVFLQFSMRSLH